MAAQMVSALAQVVNPYEQPNLVRNNGCLFPVMPWSAQGVGGILKHSQPPEPNRVCAGTPVDQTPERMTTSILDMETAFPFRRLKWFRANETGYMARKWNCRVSSRTKAMQSMSGVDRCTVVNFHGAVGICSRNMGSRFCAHWFHKARESGTDNRDQSRQWQNRSQSYLENVDNNVRCVRHGNDNAPLEIKITLGFQKRPNRFQIIAIFGSGTYDPVPCRMMASDSRFRK